MNTGKKFNPKKIQKLTDPGRKVFQNPDLIWDTLNLSAPEILVDIGAGAGFFAMPLSDKVPKATVYACDTAPELIEWMETNIPTRYAGRIRVIRSEENSIPLADGIADLVYMINLHHELDSPLTMLKESRRLLKPGGAILVIDWKKEETPMGPPVSIRISPKTVSEQLQQADFHLVTEHDLLEYHYFVTAKKPGA
ncbi:class I SAM-dependent methyltransferase [Desulfogranum marinum]|jgi:ubiquinone/menaquinone biosynthesis C-methylase UbiE|uniref:class I SAM-dependent methyltransferase n=1 Tax=Desulfogranum marinum TaxID=453220 RepID=UPI0019643DA1|nr:class I SAM-dependent methyltransferase [Desulfogranum marinum]MBM9513800.1 class I SAM-dependent methyltransferase [Desulfogranum marinum]